MTEGNGIRAMGRTMGVIGITLIRNSGEATLEKAWTERCINLRTVGQTILNALGFQSVPPDIAYNPRRPIQLLFEIVEGLYIYYFDGFVGDMRTSARAKAHYFDTLITKNIDPIMMFQILDLTSYAMEIVEDITGNMTVPDIVKELPEELQQTLHVTWEEVQNQYNTTVSVTEQLAQFGRSMGKSKYFGSHITSALIEEIFSKRFQKSSNATYNATNNATNTTALEENANILVSSVESPVPLRRLLASASETIFDQCPLLEELIAAGTKTFGFLLDVYESDGPFAYSVCRAEKFNDPTINCEKNHAPESTGTPPPACVGTPTVVMQVSI